MSAQWTPSASAPPPPSRRGGGAAFRDTLIIAAVAVVGVIGLLIWDGGDSPSALGSQGDQPDGATPATVVVPDVSGGDAASAAVDAPAAGADPATAGQAPTAAGAAPAASTGSYEANVGMQDSLIGMLPVPAGATELPPDGAGVRTWTISGTDWQGARDAYLQVLTGQGYTYVMTEAIVEGAETGELYTLTHSSGPTLQLAVGLYQGQSFIEVTRQ